MAERGQPRALDADKQKTVCSLVAAGASLRQAARFVDCDPKTIRREAQRNDDFRRELAKAKTEARMHPLETLRQAAKNNWRAALCWMERIDPDRFARPNASVVTKREANQFVADLIESIERVVSNPQERKNLFDLLAPAMPTAMRRRWNGPAMRRALEQMKSDFAQKRSAEDNRNEAERRERNLRRHALFIEIGKHLPDDLYEKLGRNGDLLDPEEVFSHAPPLAATND
jgi:hypothetical protein